MVCASPQILPERAQTHREESAALLGQDGWCCLDDPDDARYGGWTHTTLEDLNVQLLCEAEALLRRGDVKAHEICDRCCRKLEQHLQNGIVPGAPHVKALSAAGEAELLCLAVAQRVRCCLLKQDFQAMVNDSKMFGRLHEEIVDAGKPALLHELERRVLESVPGLAPEANFLGHVILVGAAAELAVQCRERVGNGYMPQTVLDHALRAVNGLQTLDVAVFPGLNSLRAHLHVSRAQACLELEMWTDAAQEAKAALERDASFKEAEFLLKAAKTEEW